MLRLAMMIKGRGNKAVRRRLAAHEESETPQKVAGESGCAVCTQCAGATRMDRCPGGVPDPAQAALCQVLFGSGLWAWAAKESLVPHPFRASGETIGTCARLGSSPKFFILM